MRRLIAVGLVCLLAVSCGNGGSGEQQGYVDAIAVSLASGDPTAINLAGDEARCVATKWVAGMLEPRARTLPMHRQDEGTLPSSARGPVLREGLSSASQPSLVMMTLSACSSAARANVS